MNSVNEKAANKRSRGDNWSQDETKALLGIWEEETVRRGAEDLVCKGADFKTYISLCKRLNEEGFERMPEQVQSKCKKLRQMYTQVTLIIKDYFSIKLICLLVASYNATFCAIKATILNGSHH